MVNSSKSTSQLVPFAGFGMGFGVGLGCGTGVGFGIGGTEFTKVPGFGGLGGCGIGGGFGYGWFALAWGMPVRPFSSIFGWTNKMIRSRVQQELQERQHRATPQLPCEQDEEETELDEHMQRTLQLMQERRERFKRRYENGKSLF